MWNQYAGQWPSHPTEVEIQPESSSYEKQFTVEDTSDEEDFYQPASEVKWSEITGATTFVLSYFVINNSYIYNFIQFIMTIKIDFLIDLKYFFSLFPIIN